MAVSARQLAANSGWCMLLACIVLALAGCSESPERPLPSTAGWETHRSDLGREMTPDVPADDLAELVRGNHELVLSLYDQLQAGDENLLLSPLSIRVAFAMVFAGARGETEAEMADVLRYTLDQSRLHAAFNALDLTLAERNDSGDEGKDEPIELHLANAFWGRTDFPFRPDYLDILAVNYGSGIHTLDFRGAPENARHVINTWVADRTRQRIRDLLPEHAIHGSTVAVLTNALYFKAPWALPFDEADSQDGDFHRLDGSIISVPMMKQTCPLDYAEGDGYQALELNYRLDELSMVILLPASDRFGDFEAGLDAAHLAAILDDLSRRHVSVALPRFTFESEFMLSEFLRALGMVVPFTEAADFRGIVEGGGIFIDEAYHKTFIAVDEHGTEAAAATAVVIGETGFPADPAVFSANRPFIFLIRDQETGVVLFLGRVMHPES